MSTTLSNGYKIPVTGETMPTWCQIISDDIIRVNSHNHDGTNSAVLNASAITKTTASVLAANWIATSGGTYRQLMTLPGTYTVAATIFKFLNANGDPLLLTVEQVTSNTYYVYINDNSLTLTAVYG